MLVSPDSTSLGCTISHEGGRIARIRKVPATATYHVPKLELPRVIINGIVTVPDQDMSTDVMDERAKQEEHDRRNCLFCKLGGRLEDSEKYRALNLGEVYGVVGYALLDRSPKVLGHSLVIARKPFDDFTDHIQGCDDQKLKVFQAAMTLAENLKRILNAQKVYLMTMCEHWEMWETEDGQTTEHLHFHLVPRYEGMRNKREAGENLLAREGTTREKEQLEDLAKSINGKINRQP